MLQGCDLLGGELHIYRGNRVVEMVQLGGADDRGGNNRFRQEPGERNLCPRDATGFGHLGDAISDFLVGFFRLGEQPAKCLVGLGADATVVPVAAKFAARLRAPGDDADAFGRSQR